MVRCHASRSPQVRQSHDCRPFPSGCPVRWQDGPDTRVFYGVPKSSESSYRAGSSRRFRELHGSQPTEERTTTRLAEMSFRTALANP